jgi:steroid delta-isomerase-like uncharacterized protein
MKKFYTLFAMAIIFVIASCNMPDNSSGKKSAATKARVQEFYDQVINAHNVAAIDSFCTADFVDHNPDEGHSGKGLDDLKASFKDFFSAFPDVHVTTNFMICEGDTVMAHVTMTGTNSGPMGNMPASNKQISMNGIDIIAVNGSKATERWGIFDMSAMMKEMGPPPAAAMADTTKK